MDKQVEYQPQLEIKLVIDKIKIKIKEIQYFKILIIIKHLW